jgi:hypothetical protein
VDAEFEPAQLDTAAAAAGRESLATSHALEVDSVDDDGGEAGGTGRGRRCCQMCVCTRCIRASMAWAVSVREPVRCYGPCGELPGWHGLVLTHVQGPRMSCGQLAHEVGACAQRVRAHGRACIAGRSEMCKASVGDAAWLPPVDAGTVWTCGYLPGCSTTPRALQ